MLVNHLQEIATAIRRDPEAAFMCWAMRLLSTAMGTGNAEMCLQSGLIISRGVGHALRCWLRASGVDV